MPIGKKLKALQKKVTKIVLTSNEIRNPSYQHYLHATELLND